MINFVNAIITDLENNFGPAFRYALTFFNDAVRTEVKLDDNPTSINSAPFEVFINGLIQASGGFTCTGGGLQSVFRANFGSLDGFGKVDPSDTLLRPGVATVIFLITDGFPTFNQYTSAT